MEPECGYRYYVKSDLMDDWKEVSRADFIMYERRAGFRPKGGGENKLATAGFTSSRASMSGRVVPEPLPDQPERE